MDISGTFEMMRSVYLRVGLLFVALLLTIAPSAAQRITRGDPLETRLNIQENPADPAYLREVAAEQGSVRVIVSLQTEQAGRMAFDAMSEQSQQAVIAQTQDALLAELGMTRTATGVKRYTAFPALALQLNSEQLAIVQESGLVVHIREDRWREPSLFEGTTNIGMRGTGGAWAAGAEGEGQVVVVIDSGVSNTHPYLAGKVVAEACFSSNATGSGFTVSSLCPGGAPSSTAPNSGAPCTLLDPNANAAGQCHHGTHLANIIAGRDTVNAQNPYDGVARKAKVISIQVFSRITDDANPATPAVCNRTGYPYNECILASDSDILAGLDHVLSNFVDTHEIAAVNMSFGNESWDSQAACDAAYPDYKARVDLFRAAGIAVVSSSGNQGGLNFMNAPACISGVISVGANCDGSANCLVNTIAPFTNAAPFLTFLAPGVSIDAATPDVIGHSVRTGTSQSAAFVSGAYAALRSYRPGATIDQITTVLRQSATPIDDYATPAIEAYPKIQVNAALPLLIFPDQPALLSPAANAAFAETPITFVWTAGEETHNYRLQVYNNSKSEVLAAVTVQHADCAEDPVNYPGEGAVCSASISYPFKDDRFYQWRVVARNKTNGSSSPSEWRAFQFDTPGAATLLSPDHKITINQPEELFQFQWSEVALADSYRVTLYDVKNGSVKLNTPVLAEGSVCAASVCTYMTTPADVAGLRDDRKYKWYVTSISADGTSRSTERVIKAKFPAAPLLTSPADGHVFRSLNEIALSWTEVAGADAYQIRIVDTGSGKTAVAETLVVDTRTVTCLSGTCTFVPSLDQRTKFKNKHTYRWTVTASNTLGSNTSAALTFKTKFPAPPVLISPAHQITLENPAITFVFTQIADADSYELVISLKANGNVVLQRGLTPGGNLTCNGTECSYTLNASDQPKLKNGKTHLWLVRSVSSAGKSASAKREFTLQSPLPAMLVSPAANAKLHSRADATFSWNDVGGVSYQLQLKDLNSGKKIVKASVSSASCSGGTCSYTLNATQQGALKNSRDYKWWVVATNSFGQSVSQKRILKTEFPRTPVPLTPANNTTLNSAASLTLMEWQSGGTVAPVTYRLRVRRADNKNVIFDETFVNGAGLACDAAKCAYTVSAALQNALRDDRNYQWWVVASSVDGSRSGPKFTLKARFP
jgi:subtilisin